jgi:hypothetical protein
MPGHDRGLRPDHPPQTVNPGTRISFGPSFRTVAESCNAASAGPGCRSSDASVSNALMTAIEQQPGYFSHSDAAAGPVDRFPYRQTLIGSHRPQSSPSPPLSDPNQGIAFTQRGQHYDEM